MSDIKRRKKETAQFKELIDETSVSKIVKEMQKKALKRLPNPEFNAFTQSIKLIKAGKCFFCSCYRLIKFFVLLFK